MTEVGELTSVFLGGGGDAISESTEKGQIKVLDVLVIGWINPAEVPLDPSGIDDEILRYYPYDGMIKSRSQRRWTALHLGHLALLGGIHPVYIRGLSPQERNYILLWLFKHAANAEPPKSFASESEMQKFIAMATNYKLVNRLQTMTSPSQSNAKLITCSVRIGVTTDPIFHEPKAGSAGPNNGKLIIEDDAIKQINDGSPDAIAVRAFNTLVGNGLKWSNIGSLICVSGDTYSTHVQVYPTYYIYAGSGDGKIEFQREQKQAPNPNQNFSSAPYPPGKAPFILE